MAIEFEESKYIEQVLDFVKKNPIKFKKGESKFPMNNKRINKAFIDICEKWNQTQKSRNFIITCVSKMLPLRSDKKVIEFDENDDPKDAFINIPLVGTDEIVSACSTFSNSYEYSNSKIDQQKASGDYQSFEIREDSIRDWCQTLPKAVLHADFAYYADGFDKYFCRESIYALKMFVKLGVKAGDPWVTALANKIQQKRDRYQDNAVANHIGKQKQQEIREAYRNMGTLKI